MAFTTPLNTRKVSGNGGTTRVFSSFTATAGSTVVVRISDSSGNGVSSVADNLGNSYSIVGTKQSAGGVAVWFYAKTGHSGGAGCVVTVTFTGSNDASCDLMEWPASTIDTGSRVQAGSTNSPFAQTTNTLASASSVVLLGIGTGFGGSVAYAETTGFTKSQEETDGNSFWTGASWYKVVAATTAVASNITVSGSGGQDGARIIFALNEASGGGVTCTLAVTDASDTVDSTATVGIAATLAGTDSADTVSAAAAVRVTATVSATDAADSLSSTAVVGNPSVTCALAATDASDSLAATAQVVVTTALTASDASDTLSAVAVTSGPITATLSVVDEPDGLAATLQTVAGAGDYEEAKRRKRKTLEQLARQVLEDEQREEKPAAVEIAARPVQVKAKAVQKAKELPQVLDTDDEDEIEALLLM